MLVLKNIQRKRNQRKRFFQHQMGDYIRVLKQSKIKYQPDTKNYGHQTDVKQANLT